MSKLRKNLTVAVLAAAMCLLSPLAASAQTKAWTGAITLPTYPWEDDVNPKFWALEGAAKLSATTHGAIVYPYPMQDHLSRTKVDRTYRAAFLENEYLKVTCLPELGGRLHSVFDKTTQQEMFHTNRVIKPGMIAMRGAWISGGVEWNSGPQGHTVTVLSPVDVFCGQSSNGSAWLEINNVEKIFRTRWTVRLTLHPGKAYLDERICISNPTDAMHPYYFWNCTAFPNRPGTRFIYPMTLGTDHNAREFFNWPIHQGKDLSWLRNYERYTSVFAVNCPYDFFGAYDVDADCGIVSAADHYELGGKKAWTWGQWEFGKVAQKNLTDDDGPYIEVQSGPLPTQSDYGMLWPHEEVSWQEYWYPVHGLGDGFEYATRDLAFQTARDDGNLRLRVISTAAIPQATCLVLREGREIFRRQIDLSPQAAREIEVPGVGQLPVEVVVNDTAGKEIARFRTPLPIPKVSPPDPAKFREKPDAEMSVEELYLKGRRFDRATSRTTAREYYEKALAKDPGHVPSLRALAVMDVQSALYQQAIERLEKAVERDPDDGLSWYFLGVGRLRLGQSKEALHCGHRAARCFGTVALGYDLAGRAAMCRKEYAVAYDLFNKAVVSSAGLMGATHGMLAWYAKGERDSVRYWAEAALERHPADLVLRALLALRDEAAMKRFTEQARACLGEYEFELLETSLALADLGLLREASKLIEGALVEAAPENQQTPLPLYYLAYYASLQGDPGLADRYLKRAAAVNKDSAFPSRPEEVEILKFAVAHNPTDANAHLHLGNLLAHLGRLDEAAQCWQQAAELSPAKAMPRRNLGLLAWAKGHTKKAEELYRQAVAVGTDDQTLYRDLAEILLAAGKRPEAIKLIESMPLKGMRRAEITILLAQAYVDQERYDEAVKLLESTPYFVNWEGQDVTWKLFNKSHVERGRQRMEGRDFQGALQDFEAALTYPANLNVGRQNRLQEAPAQYWRGTALAALGRMDQARAAWREGAAGDGGTPDQKEYRDRCRESLEKAK